jgi:hypothetical protein
MALLGYVQTITVIDSTAVDIDFSGATTAILDAGFNVTFGTISGFFEGQEYTIQVRATASISVTPDAGWNKNFPEGSQSLINGQYRNYKFWYDGTDFNFECEPPTSNAVIQLAGLTPVSGGALYFNGTALTQLPVGESNQILGVVAGLPAYTYKSQFTGTISLSGAKTLALTDISQYIFNSSSSNYTITIPANATVAIPVGTQFAFGRVGTGTLTVQGASSVSVNGVSTGTATVETACTLIKVGTNEWHLFGDISAVSPS